MINRIRYVLSGSWLRSFVTLKEFLSFWPVAVMVLSFLLTFNSLAYGTMLLCAALLGFLFVQRKLVFQVPHHNINLLDVFIAACIVIEFIAYSQSSFRFNSRPFLLIVFHAIIVFYFIRFSITTERLRVGLLWCISLLALYWALLTIQKAFAMMSVISARGLTDLSQFRNGYIPFVGTNGWTLFLILLLPFTSTVFLFSRRRILRLAAGTITALVAYCIVLGFSRAGYVALFMFFSVVFFGVLIYHRQGVVRYTKGIVVGVVLLGAASFPHWPVMKTTLMMNETVSQQRSTESRWRMWKVGKSSLQTDPLFGVGAYNFPFKYNIDHQREPDEAPLGRVTSVVTQLITEKGIPGILLPACFFLLLFFLSWRCLHLEPYGMTFSKLFIITCIAALIGVLIRELTVSVLLFRGFIFHLFCLLMGLGLALTEKRLKQFVFSRIQVFVLCLPFLGLLSFVSWNEVAGRHISHENHATISALKSSAFDKSLKHSENLTRFLPQHPIPHIHAATALAQCLAKDSVNWGNLFSHEGDADAALLHLNAAAAIEPRDETLEFGIGWLSACQSRWSEALIHFKNAYAVDPTLAVYPLAIGLVYEKQGNINPAVAYYAHAMALDPDIFISGFYREFAQRNPDVRDTVLTTALSYFADTISDPISMARKGVVYFFQGDHDRAETYLSRASADLPRMNRPYYFLGAIALMAGDTAKAVSLWKKSSFLDPNDQLVNWQLGMLMVQRDSTRALRLLQRATKSRKSEPFAQKRNIFYPGMAVFGNTILSGSVMEYINPEVDKTQIRGWLKQLSDDR